MRLPRVPVTPKISACVPAPLLSARIGNGSCHEYSVACLRPLLLSVSLTLYLVSCLFAAGRFFADTYCFGGGGGFAR